MASLAHLLLAAAALCALAVSALPATAGNDIPVAVVLEEDADDNEIKRPPVDLRNPGPPQRQEHETQNPEHFAEQALKLFSLKENIERTQDLLRQGFQGVSDDIQKWISDNDQLNIIQQNIQNLRETFTNQIQKLNETLQGFVSPPPVDQANEESQPQRDFRMIESRLKMLQDNFRSGVNTLSEGIQIVASLKSHNENLRQSNEVPANPEHPTQPEPAPAPPANPPQNILVQYAEILQNSVSNSLGNVTQAIGQFFVNTGIQNLFNRNNGTSSASGPAPAGTVADTPDNNPPRPQFPQLSWPPNWNFNLNFLGANQEQGGQSNEQGTTSQQSQGPLSIFQGLQGLLPQNPFPNLFSRPPASAASTPVKPAETPAASNAVPEPAKPAESAPAEGQAAQPEAAAAADAPVTLPPPPVGPIRQILNSIPVVQRIQNTIQQNSNPDKPRDTVKSENIETKGHYGYGGNHGGNNNDISSSGVKSEPIPSEEVPKPQESEPIKPEAPAVSDKTE